MELVSNFPVFVPKSWCSLKKDKKSSHKVGNTCWDNKKTGHCASPGGTPGQGLKSRTYGKATDKALEDIKLGKPCQLLESNEKSKKLCTKVDWFLLKAQAFVGHCVLCQVQQNQ